MDNKLSSSESSIVNREIKGTARDQLLDACATSSQQIHLNAWSLSDLEMLGTGVFSPLLGFAGSEDWASILD